MARKSDGEEEVALVDVDNAAATSLFSPNMWVKRPQRTPRPDPEDAAEPSAAAQPDPAAEGGAAPSKAAEAELAYLEAPDREGAKKARTEEDLAHLLHIDDSIAAQEERNARLQRELQEVAAEADELFQQGESIKRLLEALGVDIKNDCIAFAAETDEASRKRRCVEIGNRLIKNMCEPAAATKAPAPRRGRPPLNPPPVPPPPTPGAPRPVYTPPASCPLESQIAATALVMNKGDPVGALLSLIEKMLAPRTAALAATAAAAAAAAQAAAVAPAVPAAAAAPPAAPEAAAPAVEAV